MESRADYSTSSNLRAAKLHSIIAKAHCHMATLHPSVLSLHRRPIAMTRCLLLSVAALLVPFAAFLAADADLPLLLRSVPSEAYKHKASASLACQPLAAALAVALTCCL